MDLLSAVRHVRILQGLILVLCWSLPWEAQAKNLLGQTPSQFLVLLWFLLVLPVCLILLGVWWMGRVVDKSHAAPPARRLFGGLILGLVVACFVFCPGYLAVFVMQSFSQLTYASFGHVLGMSLVTLLLEALLFRQGQRLLVQKK